MKKLEEIRKLFENKSYIIRSEFINEYDFKDNYSDYYRQFILQAKGIADHLYLSDLIDLSGWLNIYDKKLRNRWFLYLIKTNHAIIKLAVLDYFKFCKKKLLDSRYESKLNALLGGRLPRILRNQILFNLICLGSDKESRYVEALKKSLAMTNDWRSIYRTLTSIKEVKIKGECKDEICSFIDKLSQKKDFGEGVKQILKEVC